MKLLPEQKINISPVEGIFQLGAYNHPAPAFALDAEQVRAGDDFDLVAEDHDNRSAKASISSIFMHGKTNAQALTASLRPILGIWRYKKLMMISVLLMVAKKYKKNDTENILQSKFDVNNKYTN